MQTDKEKEIDESTIDLSHTVNEINNHISNRIENQAAKNVADNDIDEQVVSSMQRLMEEETTVARAFIDSDVSKVSYNSDKTGSQEEAVSNKNDGLNEDEDIDNTDNTGSPGEIKKKPLTEKQKIMIGIISGVAAALLAVIIIVVIVVQNNNKKKSYQFNYDKAMQYYNSQDYEKALPYMEKAASSDKGNKNTELLFNLYQCYKNMNQDERALETLKDILAFDANNQNAVQEIASLYFEKNDINSLNELIKKYRGTEAEQYLADYMVNNPAPSIEAGAYNDNIKLQFVMDSGCKVYYTLDGSDPTEQSNLYKELIEIKAGKTTVKAIAVNALGVYSDVIELKYEVDYKKPDAPSISPESGTYEQGQKISVDYIPDGCKVYYTTDGTVPTDKSKLYTESFLMPEGNTVVSAIIIDQNNQVSAVTKRNYVVSKTSTKQLTYEEAEAILRTQLQNKGFLLADGSTTSTGGNAVFHSESQITVQNTEVYYIKCDVRTNGISSTYAYYGVDVKSGECYTVTKNGSEYRMTPL